MPHTSLLRSLDARGRQGARPRVAFVWRHPSTWAPATRAAWSASLRFRTIVLTVALSLVAVTAAGAILVWAVQTNLFASRVNQVLAASGRAAVAAQVELDGADTQSDRVRLQNLLVQVQSGIAQQAASDRIAILRVDQAPSSIAPQGFTSPGLAQVAISDDLREKVRSTGEQYWQSISLTDADGEEVPGILVGQQLTVPQAGAYELFLAYDLADAQQTLTFVQRILWLAGLVLLGLIATITWFVLRTVITPITEAAATSARFARGDFATRLPVKGDDELATLGRSFNAMADSIEAQISELAELSLVQQRFVSDVSHELRTPLTTIRLAADVINDNRAEFDPITARASELLWDQVQRFEALLGDLLEISRYDAGSVQLELEPTALASLADDVVGQMRQLAEQHGSEIRLVAPGGYTPVDMDARRVRRIVRNLVGNAIEHGEGRPIVVSVDSSQEAVALGVRDFGIGIDPDQLERVFDRFWRADPSRKRSIGGSGLGLSIAVGDAALHGGTLEVWSEPGGGAHFVLTLPRTPGQRVDDSPIRLDDREGSRANAIGPVGFASGLDAGVTGEDAGVTNESAATDASGVRDA